MGRLASAVAFGITLGLSACSGGEETTTPALREAGASSSSSGGQDSGTPGAADGGAKEDASSNADAGPTEPTQSGEATYYNAEGLGACGIQTPADYLVAAINDEQYSKANCGRCVSVTGPKGTVVVKVIDKCPGCDSGDLDLSETAFTKIADKSAGRVKITWRFVTCP